MSPRIRILSLLVLSLAAAGAGSPADGPPEPEATPARFRAFLMVVDENAVSDGQRPPEPLQHGFPAPLQEGRATKYSTGVTITIDRWCTADERAHLGESVGSGGTKALLAALKETNVGSIQIGDRRRRSIRWASYRTTPDGIRVNLALLDLLIPQNFDQGHVPSTGQPIVILDFTVPSTDDGEGTLVTVTEAGFGRHGDIEAESVPADGVERLTGVARVTSTKKEGKPRD